jgi:hypothetical protein
MIYCPDDLPISNLKNCQNLSCLQICFLFYFLFFIILLFFRRPFQETLQASRLKRSFFAQFRSSQLFWQFILYYIYYYKNTLFIFKRYLIIIYKISVLNLFFKFIFLIFKSIIFSYLNIINGMMITFFCIYFYRIPTNLFLDKMQISSINSTILLLALKSFKLLRRFYFVFTFNFTNFYSEAL